METTKHRTKQSREELEKVRAQAKQKAFEGMMRRGKQKSLLTQYSYHIVIGSFILVCLVAVVFVLSQKTIDTKTTPVIDNDTIDAWNKEAERYHYTFRTGENDFFEGWMLEDAKYTMNNIFYRDGQSNRLKLCKEDGDDGTIIPEKFNFREEYPSCAAPIQNQGNCSSNYAVIAASTISDRFCLQSDTGTRVPLNSQTYTSCDNKQNKKTCGEGGILVSFLEFVRSKGLATEQCFPFDNQAWDQECTETVDECTRNKIYDFCVVQKSEDVKREIMNNGPVITASQIYLDLLTYKSGVYQYVDGTKKFRGLQQWKIVGWDQDEEGNSYWLAENTWGESWGENGLLKIKTDQDKNYFGQMVFSVRPRVDTPKADVLEDEEDEIIDEFATDGADDEDDEDEGW